MKDWLGQEYGVGDKVVYAAMSGRSVTMVLAEVVDIYTVYRDENWDWQRATIENDLPEDCDTQLRVSLMPISSSRWEQHSGTDVFTDTRTGKRIKSPYSKEHWTGYDGSPNEPFKAHVKKTNVQKPVTLTVTENITKWVGPTL